MGSFAELELGFASVRLGLASVRVGHLLHLCSPEVKRVDLGSC